MLKTEWIKTLADVVDLGSFSAVALHRGVSAMAISKQISGLEKQVDEALLTRSSKKVQLTEAGRILLERSAVLLVEHAALSDWITERHREPSGVLTVVGFEDNIVNLTITPWVGAFLARYPKITLDIKVASDFMSITKHNADIYWGLSESLGLISPGLKRKKLHSTCFGIFAAPAYLERYGVPSCPAELEGHFIVGYTGNQPSNTLVVNPVLNYAGDIVGHSMETKVISSTGNVQLAIQGLGIINASDEYFEIRAAVKDGTLVPILKDYWYQGVNTFAYYHQVRKEQPKVRVFLDFFFAKRSEWIA